MEEQTNAHTRLQSCCPADKCYWSQKTPFPLEGNQRDPASSSGHTGCYPQGVPGTATKNSHPPVACPRLPPRSAQMHTRSCSRLAPQPAPCPAPTGVFSSDRRDQPHHVVLVLVLCQHHPPQRERSWFTTTQLQKRSCMPEPTFPPCISSGVGVQRLRSKRISQLLFFFHFARKRPTSTPVMDGEICPPARPPFSQPLPAASIRLELSHLMPFYSPSNCRKL